MTEVLRAFAVLCICTTRQSAHACARRNLSLKRNRLFVLFSSTRKFNCPPDTAKLSDSLRQERQDLRVGVNYSFPVRTAIIQITAATTAFGIYVVSPRTGDVWEYNQCKMVRFSGTTQAAAERILQRTHATDATEAKYREATGCKK